MTQDEQKKIEAAAEEFAKFKIDWEAIECKSTFKAGVEWRDKNPSPEIEALVKTAEHSLLCHRALVSALFGHDPDGLLANGQLRRMANVANDNLENALKPFKAGKP